MIGEVTVEVDNKSTVVTTDESDGFVGVDCAGQYSCYRPLSFLFAVAQAGTTRKCEKWSKARA